MIAALDRAWLAERPLAPVNGGDKNARGRVLVVGGAEFVPGALRLTGEAALRAGAGKLQLATVRSVATQLAVLLPEGSMIALPADAEGEIAPEAASLLADAVDRCDALVIGPGMSAREGIVELVLSLVGRAKAEQIVVLDAAALTCWHGRARLLKSAAARIIMTPHHGEMASLAGQPIEAIAADPESAAIGVARDFNAVIALKGTRTILAAPEGDAAVYDGGNSGLATSGSGDVLAGIIGGLAARGADPLTAAGWGVFVHGTAGERAADEIAPVGFLARDLLPFIPKIVADHSDG